MPHDRAVAPSWLTLLLLAVVAAALNAGGWTLGWWEEIAWYDEFVHFFTPFVIGAALGRVLLARTPAGSSPGIRFVLYVAGLGLLLGVAWEAFEWAIGVIDGPRDTAVDLLMDTLGASAGGALCRVLSARKAR